MQQKPRDGKTKSKNKGKKIKISEFKNESIKKIMNFFQGKQDKSSEKLTEKETKILKNK